MHGETERRLQRRDHGSNARETTVEIDRRVRIAFGVLLILFLGFTVVLLVLAVRIRFAGFFGVFFLGRSHRREFRLVILERFRECCALKLRRERVESEKRRQQSHRSLAHERALVVKSTDGEICHDEPVRQRNRLGLRHDGPRVQNASSRESARVVHALDEKIQESLLGAKQRRRRVVVVIAHRDDILLRNQQLSEHGDDGGAQRVRLTVEVRHQHGDVRHRRLRHALRDLAEKVTDAANADGVTRLLQLVIVRIDAPDFANERRGQVRVLESIGRRTRELSDRPGQVFVLVQQMNQRRGDLFELSPLQRARTHHLKRRALGHLALQCRRIFETHRRQTHEQSQEILLGLFRSEHLPQIDV